MKTERLFLNEVILGEIKDGKLYNSDRTVRFDKEILDGLQEKLDKGICLTFLEFFTLADIVGIDLNVSLTIKDKHISINTNEVMLPTNDMDWFISQHNPLFVNSSGLTIPELLLVAKDLEIKINKI